jgi:hypothetical protein
MLIDRGMQLGSCDQYVLLICSSRSMHVCLQGNKVSSHSKCSLITTWMRACVKLTTTTTSDTCTASDRGSQSIYMHVTDTIASRCSARDMHAHMHIR